MEKRLPTAALTLGQVETLPAVPNVADPLGVRDRAMLELFCREQGTPLLHSFEFLRVGLRDHASVVDKGDFVLIGGGPAPR